MVIISVIWVPGESSGYDENGAVVNAPQPATPVFIVTGSGAPDSVLEWSSVPNGGLYLDGTDLYIWNSESWVGPYTITVSG